MQPIRRGPGTPVRRRPATTAPEPTNPHAREQEAPGGAIHWVIALGCRLRQLVQGPGWGDSTLEVSAVLLLVF
jgi:hypothetical protein